MDETYVKISGKWCYLYRGIDEYGNLVDVFLSEHRDMAAAKALFQKAFDLLQTIPERVITDGHKPYPGAVEKVLGKEVEHRVSRCMDNPIEQSYRRIKQRYYPTLGFGEFESAQRFCQTVEELNQFLRPRQRMGEFVSLSKVREHTQRRVTELREIVKAA